MVDLQAALARVQERFEIRFDVAIGWATDSQLKAATGIVSWAACDEPSANCPARTIVISTHLRRAPLYVLDYLITHEYLHFLLPSKRHGHHRHFRIAEQSHTHYATANRWLHREAVRRGYKRARVDRKSAFWRVLNPTRVGQA